MRLLLITFLTAISVAALLTACRPSDEKSRLQQADMMFDSQPDSAFAIVRSIDPARLSGAYEQNLYRLLLTEGQVLRQDSCPDDIDIQTAQIFFRKHGSEKQRMKSNYYLSRVRYSNGDYRRAAIPALSAYETAQSLRSEFWIARSSALIADLYTEAQMFDKAQSFWLRAIENYRQSKCTRSERFLYCDLAICLSNQGHNARAIEILDSITTLAAFSSDTSMMTYAILPKISIYIDMSDYSKASLSLDSIRNLEPECLMTPDYLSCQASVELHKGNYDKAFQFILTADSISKDDQERLYALWQYAEYYKATGQQHKFQAFTDSILKTNNNVLGEILQQSILGSQADYLNLKHRRTERKVKKLKETTLTIILGVAVSFFLLFMLYRSKIEIKNLQLQQKINEIKKLSDSICLRNDENYRLYKYINEKDEELALAYKNIEKYKQDINRLIADVNVNQTTAQELNDTIIRQKKIIDTLNDNLQKSKEAFSTSSEKIELLFRSQWDTFNKICDEIFEKNDSPATRSLILKNIEQEIDRFKTSKNLELLEDQTNQYMSNIMVRLRQQCVFFRPIDFTLMMLIFAGFEARAICLITDNKIKTFYNTRKRLHDKIALSDAPDADLFLAKMK